MANRAYVSFWTRGYSEQLMLNQFEHLLETVPFSSEHAGFTRLTVRAVTPAETPLAEHDLRRVQAGAPEVITLAREHQNSDICYEVEASWDIWQRDMSSGEWRRGPEPLLLICNGPDYDEGIAVESGHFLADIGLEHLFTGHGGVLNSHGARSAPSDPVEAEFLAWMTHEEHLHEYYQKTRDNIQQLFRWVRTVEHALPVERYRLWSEGEENLEARLDEILAVH